MPEYVGIYFFDRKPQRKWRQRCFGEGGKGENRICSRSDDSRKVDDQDEGNPVGNLALVSGSSQKRDF